MNDQEIINILASNIRTEIKKIKATDTEIAKLIGVSHNTIGRYKRGETIPDALILYKLAKLCNTSVDALMGDSVDYKKACTVIIEELKKLNITDL